MASNHDEELAQAVRLEMNLDTEPNETDQDEEAEDVEKEPEETLVEGDFDEDEDDPHYYMGHWLVRNNHLFTNAKHNKDSEYWRCIKTDCSSSITVSKKDDKITRETGKVKGSEHTDLPLSDVELDCLAAVEEMVRACTETSDPIEAIYNRIVTQVELRWGREAVLLHLKDFKTYKSRLYRTSKTSDIVLMRKQTHLESGGRFLLFDSQDNDRMIAFASDTSKEELRCFSLNQSA